MKNREIDKIIEDNHKLIQYHLQSLNYYQRLYDEMKSYTLESSANKLLFSAIESQMDDLGSRHTTMN